MTCFYFVCWIEFWPARLLLATVISLSLTICLKFLSVANTVELSTLTFFDYTLSPPHWPSVSVTLTTISVQLRSLSIKFTQFDLMLFDSTSLDFRSVQLISVQLHIHVANEKLRYLLLQVKYLVLWWVFQGFILSPSSSSIPLFIPHTDVSQVSLRTQTLVWWEHKPAMIYVLWKLFPGSELQIKSLTLIWR